MSSVKNPAPICLFVFNRLEHTKRTIEHLLKNDLAKDTEIFVFSDGARNPEENIKVTAVRDYFQKISGFKTINLIAREKNFGLANSIIDGVTNVVNRFGRVIVMEDDLVSSPYFLKYMNDGLNFYDNNPRVASIHGYVYPAGDFPETFFIKGADCWGWATWKEKWAYFNPDGKFLLKELQRRKLCKEFNFENSYPYIRMLKNQIAGKNNSWAIRWYASAFLADLYTLYPGKSLIENIGNDSSGTHCTTTTEFDVTLSTRPLDVNSIPVESSESARNQFIAYFRKNNISRIKRGIKKILGIFS